MRLDLVNIADDWPAFAVRSVLECYGITVALHPIATASDLVRVLGGATPVSKHLVLMCHGVGEGLHLPELAPSIEAAQPYHGRPRVDLATPWMGTWGTRPRGGRFLRPGASGHEGRKSAAVFSSCL